MSYAALILKDSPEMVWALDESSGLTVQPFSFTSETIYEGSYNDGSFIRSGVPIVYAGKNSIQSVGVAGSELFSVPSNGRFSNKSKALSCTLEFWMNLYIDPKELSSGPDSRIGESKIVGFTGSSDSGLYVRDLDYLVFKIGDTGFRKFESAVHVPSFDTPQHIFIIYTPYTIQLIVNGVEGNIARISENIFIEEEEDRDIVFYHPDKINASSIDFETIQFDTIAMYNTPLSSSVAKRHYVYGLGYDVPKYIIKSLGGVSYETNMQFTTPLKQINYIDNNTWSNRILLDNLISDSGGLKTYSYNNHKMYISSRNEIVETSEMISVDGTDDCIVFPEGKYSYFEIDNYESITGGSTSKLEAKFKIIDSSSTDQQLMYIGSKSLDKFISCIRNGNNISVSYKEINGTEISLVSHTISTDTFIISIAKNGTDIDIAVVDSDNSSSTETIENSSIFPMQDSFIRFGSAPIFFENDIPVNISEDGVSRFDGGLIQVDIYQSSAVTSNYSSYPERKSANLYQVYANNETKRVCVATSGSFSINLALLDLIGLDKYGINYNEVALAPRVEIGSNMAEVKYDLNSYIGDPVVATTHIDNNDIRDLTKHFSVGIGEDIPKTEELQYVISGTLRSTDIELTPGILRYFRIYTYPVQKDSVYDYVEINDTVPGENARYYSGYSESENHSFKEMPEIERTTDLHRSFYTGVRVGGHGDNTPYLKVPFNVRTVTDTLSSKIYAVMFTGRHVSGSPSSIEFLNISSLSVTWGTPEPTGVEMYINGSRYNPSSEYDLNTWSHFCIKFVDGIDYENDINFGETGSGWLVDNISVILEDISASKIDYLYGLYFGESAERVPANQDEDFLNILISDSELSDGLFSYQPLIGQSSFLSRSLCPNLATTTNISLTLEPTPADTFKMTFGTNLDLLKIDGIEIQEGNKILFKNQTTASENGIYLVTLRQSSYVLLQKQTSPSDGSVIFITDGNENKNFYYLKAGNSYSKTITQKKVVSYNDVSPSIVATIRYGA